MDCNISLIVILLLIILVIGLIVFSYKQDKDAQIMDNSVENFVFNRDTISDQIIANNNNINALLQKLYNPQIVLKNYNANNTYDIVSNTFTDNVNNINNTLDILYENNNISNNDHITELQNKMIDLKNKTNNFRNKLIKKQKYTRIKSLNNGLEMDLISTPNTRFQDEQTGSNFPAYMVGVNNGCLSIGATDYDVYKCNDTNPKQYFKMEHILNETAYQNAIDTSLPFDNIDKSKINYPFVMMKSVNNENCLTNNHGTLTVQPCYSYVAQRWMAL
jgi:hypothetical protein